MAERAELLSGDPEAEVEAAGSTEARSGSLGRRLAIATLCLGALAAGVAELTGVRRRAPGGGGSTAGSARAGLERKDEHAEPIFLAETWMSPLAPARELLKKEQNKRKPKKPKFIPPYLQPCGGPCPNVGYTCVTKADKSYSQCIDCSDAGNYKFDCGAYDNELRLAAIEQCGASCDLAPPVPSCVLGQAMKSDYSSGECQDQPDRSVRLRCKSQDSEDCGSRLSSHGHTGQGTYQVTMQGAYGDGIVTTFYLDTYGRLTSEMILWNEVKFEVWGRECFDDQSRILTSFRVAGKKKPYDKLVTVDFDACDDWHAYTIVLQHNTISWKIDDEIVRREDTSDLKDFQRDVEDQGFEVHVAMWGQDRHKHKSWNKTFEAGVGYLEKNREEFPVYAWFANIRHPELDEGSRAPYQWVFDPSGHKR